MNTFAFVLPFLFLKPWTVQTNQSFETFILLDFTLVSGFCKVLR